MNSTLVPAILTAAVPTLLIALGIILNRSDVHGVRGEIAELRREMLARFDSVDAELRFFHGETGKLAGRIDELSRRIP